MRRASKLLLTLVAALSLTGWRCDQLLDPPETKDRLSPAAMAEMIARPIAAVRERGLAAGEAEFERLLLRETGNGVKIADLHTAFGVGLYEEWLITHHRPLLVAARDRMRKAVSAYRQAFGAKHPEVAVALHSFADIDVILNDERPTPEAVAAMREALTIRRDALGPHNAETKAAEAALKDLADPQRGDAPPGPGVGGNELAIEWLPGCELPEEPENGAAQAAAAQASNGCSAPAEEAGKASD